MAKETPVIENGVLTGWWIETDDQYIEYRTPYGELARYKTVRASTVFVPAQEKYKTGGA